MPLLFKPLLRPEKRVKRFLEEIRSDYVKVRGFLLLRRPPCEVPWKYVEYLLSPLSPSELEKTKLKAFAVVRITDSTEISGGIRSGGFVEVEGSVEPYPCGNMRVINARRISSVEYSKYWELKEYELSRREIKSILVSALSAPTEVQDSFLYSLFGSPKVLDNPLGWDEGYSLSIINGKLKVVKSFAEFYRKFYEMLPRELRLEKETSWEFSDDFLGIDFKVFDPNGGLKYYAPSVKMIRRSVPIPRWAFNSFKLKRAVYLVPKFSRPEVTDILPSLSETPFIISEPLGFELDEIEKHLSNILATVFVKRNDLPVLNPVSEEVQKLRLKFEAMLWKKRMEYGEDTIDALLSLDGVFHVEKRYFLSVNLLGSMGRSTGRVTKSFIFEVVNIDEELIDMWLNEIGKKALQEYVERYKRLYITEDSKVQRVFQLLLDLQSTSISGVISKEEIFEAGKEIGFSESTIAMAIEKLKARGDIYEPRIGFYKVIKGEKS
ncbi:minichromosome maintenance protein MCM [Pyrococcus abyssi]|uniref:Predicted ATPase involved in replication control, Cdc46/MCM familyn n=1 Tax=Pyrococcus abyssi (strain GE5 / Orsay) TaxID=272844 RepID=Q9V167_PYRAB|nr:minichromosome maintenance protein MCM [Pyrococcus abyssi]CAB49483.1 Predicted ATPase involved in replication control, Cdc46/MCM familyn [Pyrococcus abyssi GE5]CCE69951.1 TPA: hypothetical protein PAB0384 [Pyrococcus abyssi GE5]